MSGSAWSGLFSNWAALSQSVNIFRCSALKFWAMTIPHWILNNSAWSDEFAKSDLWKPVTHWPAQSIKTPAILVLTSLIGAIEYFFNSGKLLKELNTAILTLIPKVKCLSSVSKFRPIACCNTIYKCITKVMCARLKLILLVSLLRTKEPAFKEGLFIGHDITICQDLVRNYGKRV